MQLLRRPTTDHAYRQPNSNANPNPDANSNADSNAHTNSNSDSNANSNSDPNADSNAHTNSNSDSNANSNAGSRAYSATGNKRHAESCHAGRSGSLDDLTELDAHQSGTRDRAEHRQRPLHRWIGQLPTEPSRLPDGSGIGHDLDAFYGCIQHDPGSFRRVL